MRALFDACSDVNAKTEYGITPLHTAAEKGHTETVSALIDAGANPHATDDSGNTYADLL